MVSDVICYTDGSALGNGKDDACCGAGVVLLYGEALKELSIPLPNYKTNNQAELYACIAALEALKRPCKVILHTDSKYVQKGITEWIQGWKRRNWKTSKGDDVKNRELWERLDNLITIHNVEWRWVKGHADNEMNNLADELACKASARVKEERLY